MRKVTIKVAGLAVLLTGVTVVGAEEPAPAAPYRESRVIESDFPFPFRVAYVQPPAKEPKPEEKKAEPKKTALEMILEQALRNNPDILSARCQPHDTQFFRVKYCHQFRGV